MKLPPSSRWFWLFLVQLRCAAVLAPRDQRREWWKEWSAELWYVWQDANAGQAPSGAGLAISAAFCRGAFVDALWLRWSQPRSSWLSFSSAGRCVLFLAAVVAASLLAALHFSDVRNEMQASFRPIASQTVAITRHGFSEAPYPTVRFDEFLNWQTSTRKFLSQIAFYQPGFKRVQVGPHRTYRMRVARATDSLIDLLPLAPGAPAPLLRASAAGMPRVILTEAIWRKRFAADPAIVGRVIRVAGEDAIVDGVARGVLGILPGNLDALIFYGDARLAMLPGDTRGFVLARVRDSAATRSLHGQWRMSVSTGNGGEDVFDCTTLADRKRLPFSNFVFLFFLALLALPATTSLSLGEYPAKQGAQPASVRVRRWIFLTVKTLLIIPAVYLLAIDTAHFIPNLFLQIAFPFAGWLFGLRWVLRDQRQRCPVCLRVLKNPARVGQPSRNFLAWNGTELMCEAGHGLLHVPEIATSWFSTQRWLYLDPSWQSLFSAPLVTAP